MRNSHNLLRSEMYLQIAPRCSETELEEIDNTRKAADHMYFEANAKYNELFPPSTPPAEASASNATMESISQRRRFDYLNYS